MWPVEKMIHADVAALGFAAEQHRAKGRWRDWAQFYGKATKHIHSFKPCWA